MGMHTIKLVLNAGAQINAGVFWQNRVVRVATILFSYSEHLVLTQIFLVFLPNQVDINAEN